MATNACRSPAGRWFFIAATFATVVVGLVSRQIAWVPAWIGDALWATTAYFVVSAIAPRIGRWRCGAVALVFSFAIEVSQLYHEPWIDDIRQTTLGHLALGTTFTWTDLIAYTAGVALGVSATPRRPSSTLHTSRLARSASSPPQETGTQPRADH